MPDEHHAVIMQRSWVGVILCTVVLLWTPTFSVSAQEIPVFAGWEMGLVIDDGESEDNPIILEEGETTIRFWIRNDNLAGDIDIALEYDSSSSATLAGEESVTVSSASNETFTMTVSDIDLWSITAGTTYDFEISGQLTSWGLAPMVVPVSNQNVDGELSVPELHRWEVDITEIEHPISAGTEFNLHFDLINRGNTADSFTDGMIEDDCPVLTVVSPEPLSDLSGILYQPGVVTSGTLVFDASSTHPTRICTIEIEIKSGGMVTKDNALGEYSSKDSTKIDVEARPVGAQQDQDDANVGEDDGPQNQEQVTSDNFLMFPSILAPLAIVWAALIRTNKKYQF